MAAIARALHRAFPGLSPLGFGTLKQIAMFVGARLVDPPGVRNSNFSLSEGGCFDRKWHGLRELGRCGWFCTEPDSVSPIGSSSPHAPGCYR